MSGETWGGAQPARRCRAISPAGAVTADARAGRRGMPKRLSLTQTISRIACCCHSTHLAKEGIMTPVMPLSTDHRAWSLPIASTVASPRQPRGMKSDAAHFITTGGRPPAWGEQSSPITCACRRRRDEPAILSCRHDRRQACAGLDADERARLAVTRAAIHCAASPKFARRRSRLRASTY